ncbi:Type IV pilus assembly PilZ [Burkholderia multivorans]
MRRSHEYVELQAGDVAADTPLEFDLYDRSGVALLPAGATLGSAAQQDFLFRRFKPARKGEAGPAQALAGERLTLARMGLAIGTMVGIRRRTGAVRAMYRCRLIGYGPSQAIFLSPLQGAALDIAHGDDVEAVAIGRAAVFRFAATVEAVHASPVPFVILSPPGVADRLRTRSQARVPVRLAARFGVGASEGDGTAENERDGNGENGIGIVRDLSLSGMSLAADREIAEAGEPLRVWLPYEDDGAIKELALSGTVRHVRADPAAPDLWLHHVEFQAMDATDTARLKAMLFDWLIASPRAGGAG